MAQSKQDIVNKYFEYYAKRNLAGIEEVMSENVTWYFLGQHPLAGIKKGITEVVDFFNKVGKIMKESNPTIEKLIVSENSRYLIECIHSKTNRTENNNLEHYACVLWTFENGKIIEGRHFFSDQQALNKYFSALAT
jgi:ketosteroid isomerase-like protein